MGLAVVASLISASYLSTSRGSVGAPSIQDSGLELSSIESASAGLSSHLIVTTDKSIYLPGEPVNITATFPYGYTGTFPTSLTMYYMIIDSDGKVIYDMKKHVIVLMVITTWSVGPGYSRSFIWNQCDDNKTPVGYPKWLQAVVVVPAWYAPISAIAKFEINPMPTTFDLAVAPGWNQLSLPPLNDSWTAGGIGLAAGSIVIEWDEPTQSYGKAYIVGVTPETLDFRLIRGSAYLILTQESQILTLYGCSPEIFDEYSIDLNVPIKGGWACVGFNSLGPGVNASSVDDLVIGAKTIMVCKWNRITGMYDIYLPGITPSGYDFVIGPGDGCWLRIDGPATLTYSP